MAVRQDEVQLKIEYITDESREMSRAIQLTKQYQQEINAATGRINAYQKELAKANLTEAKRAELLAKVAEQEKIVANNLGRIAAEGKKVENLDLGRLAPQQLIDRARQLQQALARIPQSAAEYGPLQQQLAQVNTRLRDIRQASSGISPGGGAADSGLFGLLGRAVPIVTALTVAYGGLKRALTGGAELEQLTISFETFLGSARAAKEVIADLKAFEVKTPFEAEQVNNAGRALLAFGVSTQDLIPTLTRVGDVAAGTSKDFNELIQIYGKAKSSQLIQGEELNQLAEAGIPIYAELGKVLGVNETRIRKLGEQGKITFADLDQVFTNLTSEGGRFAGLMERQSTSLSGLFSTLKSQFSNILADLGTKLGPAIKEGLNNAIQFLNNALPVIQQVFSFIGDGASKVVQFNNFLITSFKEFIGLFSVDNAQKIIAFFGPIGDLINAQIDKYQAAQAEAAKVQQQLDARSRAEDARDDRQLSAAEKQAIADKQKQLAEEAARRKRLLDEEAAKRAEAAFQAQLKKADTDAKRLELIVEGQRAQGLLNEAQYQAALSNATEQGLQARLAVYQRFGRQQVNDALEIQNQLFAIQTGRAERAGATTVAPLGARQTPGVSSNANNTTSSALEVAGIGQDLNQSILKDKFDAALVSEQEYQLASLELKRQYQEEQLAILRSAETLNLEEIKRVENEKLKTEEDIADKRRENAERLAELKARAEEAALGVFKDSISVTIDLLARDEAARKKNASVIKAFQIGEITVQYLTEVQKIWAKNAALPGGQIISAGESLLAGIRSGIAIAKVNKQKFFWGGPTGSGFGIPDETGAKPAGIVHANEYVIPEWMMMLPEIKSSVSWLEGIRQRGYADGGLVTASTTPSATAIQSAAPMLSWAPLQMAAETIYKAAKAMPTEVRGRWVYQDFEDAAAPVVQARADASF